MPEREGKEKSEKKGEKRGISNYRRPVDQVRHPSASSEHAGGSLSATEEEERLLGRGGRKEKRAAGRLGVPCFFLTLLPLSRAEGWKRRKKKGGEGSSKGKKRSDGKGMLFISLVPLFFPLVLFRSSGKRRGRERGGETSGKGEKGGGPLSGA